MTECGNYGTGSQFQQHFTSSFFRTFLFTKNTNVKYRKAAHNIVVQKMLVKC